MGATFLLISLTPLFINLKNCSSLCIVFFLSGPLFCLFCSVSLIVEAFPQIAAQSYLPSLIESSVFINGACYLVGFTVDHGLEAWLLGRRGGF